MKGNWVLRSIMAVLTAGAVFLAGCDDGGGDDINAIAGTGQLIVRGNVVAFSEGNAPAAVAGGKIYLEGTDIEAELGTDGKFSFIGVPAGTYTAVFEFDGIEGTLEIVVKEGFWLEIRNVTVYEDGTVQATIIYHPLGDGIIDVKGDWIVQRTNIPGMWSHARDQMVLNQNKSNLSGTLATGCPDYTLAGSINGHNISIEGSDEWGGTIQMNGTVNGSGSSMSGTWVEGGAHGTWTALHGVATPGFDL